MLGQACEPSMAGPRGPPGLTLPHPGLRAAALFLYLPRPVSWCVNQGHNFLFCSAAKTKYASEGLTQQKFILLVRDWPSEVGVSVTGPAPLRAPRDSRPPSLPLGLLGRKQLGPSLRRRLSACLPVPVPMCPFS